MKKIYFKDNYVICLKLGTLCFQFDKVEHLSAFFLHLRVCTDINTFKEAFFSLCNNWTVMKKFSCFVVQPILGFVRVCA